MKFSNKPQKQLGFTIVELLIVIVVIGILAAITVVAFNGVSGKAIDSSMKSDISGAAKILANDHTVNSIYPTTLTSANGGKGITTSGGSTYSYVPNNSSNPPTYSLVISNTKSTNSYRVTNSSFTPTLVTGSAPVVTTPTVASVTSSDGCGGGYFTLQLYSTATGSPTPTVQWQRLSVKNTTSGTWVDIGGATTSYHGFNSSGLLSEGDYFVFRAVWTSGSFTTIAPTMQIYLTNGC